MVVSTHQVLLPLPEDEVLLRHVELGDAVVEVLLPVLDVDPGVRDDEGAQRRRTRISRC